MNVGFPLRCEALVTWHSFCLGTAAAEELKSPLTSVMPCSMLLNPMFMMKQRSVTTATASVVAAAAAAAGQLTSSIFSGPVWEVSWACTAAKAAAAQIPIVQ